MAVLFFTRPRKREQNRQKADRSERSPTKGGRARWKARSVPKRVLGVCFGAMPALLGPSEPRQFEAFTQADEVARGRAITGLGGSRATFLPDRAGAYSRRMVRNLFNMDNIWP